MKFAKWVFAIASVYGFLVTVPLYFAENYLNQTMPPAINHPEYYYGFLGVILAWQTAFVIVATDPPRYRIIMIAAIIEKLAYVPAMFVLYWQGRVVAQYLVSPIADLILGILFVIAFILTTRQAQAAQPSARAGSRQTARE